MCGVGCVFVVSALGGRVDGVRACMVTKTKSRAHANLSLYHTQLNKSQKKSLVFVRSYLDIAVRAEDEQRVQQRRHLCLL